MLSVGGIATLAARRSLAPTPDIAQIRALARAGQFPHAQTLLNRLLQTDPKNERAHLLMAQLTVEPANSHPDVTLRHLRKIRPDGPKQAARLKFVEGKARYQQGRYDLAESIAGPRRYASTRSCPKRVGP